MRKEFKTVNRSKNIAVEGNFDVLFMKSGQDGIIKSNWKTSMVLEYWLVVC